MHRFILLLAVFSGVAFIWAAEDAAHEEGVEWTGKPWMGKWVAVPEKDENHEGLKKKLHIPLSHPHLKHNNRVWVNTYKKGDEYHHKIIIKEAGYTNDVVFKLGQESAGSYNGSSFTVKYEDRDGALVGTVHHTGTKEQPLDKTINNVFKLEGDHLVKTSTIDGVTMKRYYKTRT